MYHLQEQIASVKHRSFTDLDLLKAMAVVSIFETGRPFGRFDQVAVLNDGAGISYGFLQFTHRSGSLAAVVEEYLRLGGDVARGLLTNALPLLRRTEPAIVRNVSLNDHLKKALRDAAATGEMREAQMHVAVECYLKPAIDECERMDFELPLSLAVVYDSMTHGSYEKIRDQILRSNSAGIPRRTAKAVTRTHEKAWITEYVRRRDRWLASIPRLNATRYRTRFFLIEIALGRWQLDLPLNVNGYRLRNEDLISPDNATGGSDPAAGPNTTPLPTTTLDRNLQNPSQIPASTPQAQPPDQSRAQSSGSSLRGVEQHVVQASQAFDRIDRTITAVTTRTDRAKSLWATVVGTLWQTLWAMLGFFWGLPREFWIVVAVIAAVLTLVYLYRQIALGIIRERSEFTL